MNKTELLEKLRMLKLKTNDEWMLQLEERKLKELEFHNRDRDESFKKSISHDTYDKIYGNRKFYKTVKLSTNYVDKWIEENVKGKIFIDYACGEGSNAILAAKMGADLSIGIDISDISIKNAEFSANKQGLSSNIFFVQGDAENTGLPGGCIDTIICSGMLHHLDLSYAFFELRRILKPGGKILAVEALDYNPLIKLYRMSTPQMRTDWEKAHILSYKDIKFARRFFKVQNIRHWHLFSIFGTYMPGFLPLLNFMDKILLKVPVIKLLSWMFTFELVKE
jgi:ubiquinone/menaquinone biosynthesis C-methylase UbiE